MLRAFRCVAFVTLAFVPCASASVRVVSPTGPYVQIQTAISASVDGDTILVKPGTYSGFAINGTSLTIAADPEGSVFLTTLVSIQFVPAGKSVALSGLQLIQDSRIDTLACAGSLRFQALSVAPTALGSGPAMTLVGSSDVALLRCNLTGYSPLGFESAFPTPGLYAGSARVAIYDSQLTGGRGTDGHYIGVGGSSLPALVGAPGCNLTSSSTLFASGSTLRGGDGGTGVPGLCSPFIVGGGPGAPGGVGLSVGANSQATLAEVALVPGAGGVGGPGGSCGSSPGTQGPAGAPSSGPVVQLLVASRHATCASVVRELAPLAVTVTGQPGDLVWLQIGGTPTWSLDLAFFGVRLVSAAHRSTRIFLGTLPGSGTLTTTLVFPDMGPGVEARTNHMQALFRDTTGQNVWGTGEVFTLLDSAF